MSTLNEKLVAFCHEQASLYPPLKNDYLTMADLFTKKLWHQLTQKIYEFVLSEGNSVNDSFVVLYNNFIVNFESRLNQLKLAQIICQIANTQKDLAESAHLVQSSIEKSARFGPEPSLLLRSELGLINLKRGLFGDLKDQIKADKYALEELENIADTAVFSSYYLLATEYYKCFGPAEKFYSNALSYLAYTPLETLNKDRQLQLATDISISAITAEGVFNFGEVVNTSAVKALESTGKSWLGQLLHSFNKGDIDAFNVITKVHQEEMSEQPILVARADFIKEKLLLMSLINMIFEIPSDKRDVHFKDIARNTRLPIEQVEYLIMKAMSLGLMRGSMDEVNQVLHVSWVKPRVLDQNQISHIEARVSGWKNSVMEAHNYMENLTPELFG
mmetsp:Transcript_12197/g.18246  ORF Transcript_12197/g.18246 Transcript_12197/m.18246 type:complete len:388 (+) Transcript_12197:43-1206(+)|eukprot:CAMPEP_0171461118 /NCGR_PEP_ID=MMETSP0945-20130129/5699_1 /TAXON_ID=109269 /ORGANISM="Vaucheria litorea, Strain CCMP2940" /LENGTH=387 /DNA_ID=CAMNT_0011987411 /DNA_START=19 /DNA_END=1182 /DNA_ORIENTATION=-